jgi:lysylphosphatidylglycerol synthetase-like protein (DUF2156 family)
VFDAPIANLKHKLELAVKSTVGGIVAFAAALVALGFFCAAAFLWLEEHYGAITASLVMGAAFTIVALIAVIVILIVRHRRPPPPPPRKAPLWADPVLLATALDITRVLGRKRLTVAVLVSAFVAGILLQKTSGKREDEHGQ